MACRQLCHLLIMNRPGYQFKMFDTIARVLVLKPKLFFKYLALRKTIFLHIFFYIFSKHKQLCKNFDLLKYSPKQANIDFRISKQDFKSN